MESPMPPSGSRPKKAKKRSRNRSVYPLDITGLGELLKAAKKKTGIKNKAELLRLSIARGLPILAKQLATMPRNTGAQSA